ncbi:TetR/AcrR family transcriptional regulator [Blastococcus sp. URHD0036]|uniref:TetR/AcrR family transcriptional regulator n=1 Tax=Blastococcus sp. URHD0036 TaxID=1380356 RepID=UPI0018CBFF48|nr:TetR/AcrR family transcriptional regulator [Blastococcus sp. URHD0036]
MPGPADGGPVPGSRPIGRPPNADAAATRRAIVAAAAGHLTAVGHTRMNLAAVAADAGITRAAIYRYFDSKQDLVRAVVQEVPASYDQMVQTDVLPEQGLVRQVRALVQVAARSSFADPRSSLDYFDLARLSEADDAVAEVFREASRRIRTVIVEIVRRAGEAGELAPDADPAEVVEAVSGLVWSFGAGASEAPNDAVRRQVLLATELVLREAPWAVDAPAGRPLA